MGNKRRRKSSKVSKAGYRNPKIQRRRFLEKARSKRWAVNNAENDGQDISDNDTISGASLSDNDTVNYNVGENMSDDDNVGLNLSDNDTISGDVSDIEPDNIDKGHLVITDEGSMASTPRKRMGSTKGPSRKLPYEPRRPMRSGWLDVMNKSRRSSARFRRADELAASTSGSAASCGTADQPQQPCVPDEPVVADDVPAGSQVNISSVNPTFRLRNDMIRISQENATSVHIGRTRSEERLQADTNESFNYEVLDSMVTKKPKPTPGKNPYYCVLCNEEI